VQLRLIAIACLPLLGAGCAQIQLVRDDIARVDRKVDSARAETKALQKPLDQSGDRSAEELNRLRADLLTQFQQVSSDLQRVQNRLEALEQRLGRVDQEVGVIRAGRTSTGAIDTAKTKSVSALEQGFKTASDDFQRGRYDLAYRGFQDVLSRDSSGNFSPRAVFQMGECRYAQGNWDEARTLYQRVVRDWPDAEPQVCPSWFKLGLAYEKLRQIPERDSSWARLQKRCPGTNEAQRAKDLLSR